MDHLDIILEHSRFYLNYTDLHVKSIGEKYIVYFLVSQVMSLKQCQHNDHVLAIIKNLLCFIFQSQDLDFLCTCYIHELVLFLFYTLYLIGHQSNVCACCPLLYVTQIQIPGRWSCVY